MQQLLPRTLTRWVAGAFLVASGGCGGGGDTQDGSVLPDARILPDGLTIDALNPNELRSGTVAVIDMAGSNPDWPYSGASVSIIYRDLTTPDVTPAYRETTPPESGNCTVWVYTKTLTQEQPQVDEGSVTIEGTLSPIGTCSFDVLAGSYRCPAGSDAVPQGSEIFPDVNDTVKLVISGAEPFAGVDAAGMYVELGGFANPVYNGRHPVVAQPDGATLILANRAAAGQAPETVADTGATFALYAGAGPTPANRDFLDDGSDLVTINKESGPIVTKFSAATRADGAGLRLSDDSAQPHELPATAQEVTFRCNPAQNGVCGPENPSIGLIRRFVITGTTTDADLTGTGPTDMPEHNFQYARFQCLGQNGNDAITIPQGAMQAILNTNPSRIRTEVLRVNVDRTTPQSSVLVGHGLVGFSDVNVQ